jgi:hypothetical protein
MAKPYSMLATLWATVFLAVSAQAQTAKPIRATRTSINDPSALALDGRGHLFAIESKIVQRSVDGSGGAVNVEADTNSVVSIDLQNGTMTTVAGNGKKRCYRDGAKATTVSLGYLDSVTTDALGNILLSGNGRIRKIDMASGLISTVAGDGTNDNTIEGAPALSTPLRGAGSLAVDAHGNLFVTEFAQIFRLDIDSGTIHLFAGNGQIGLPVMEARRWTQVSGSTTASLSTGLATCSSPTMIGAASDALTTLRAALAPSR